MWYLIASIPDLCILTYFYCNMLWSVILVDSLERFLLNTLYSEEIPIHVDKIIIALSNLYLKRSHVEIS